MSPTFYPAGMSPAHGCAGRRVHGQNRPASPARVAASIAMAIFAWDGTASAGSLWVPQQSTSIHVTAGKFVSKGAHVSGYAEIVERDGKRFLVISHLKSPKCRVLLVKLENITDDESVKSAPKLDLGLVGTGASVSYPLSKSIDVWLYRSVSLWNAKTGKSLGIAELRSDQEKSAS